MRKRKSIIVACSAILILSACSADDVAQKTTDSATEIMEKTIETPEGVTEKTTSKEVEQMMNRAHSSGRNAPEGEVQPTDSDAAINTDISDGVDTVFAGVEPVILDDVSGGSAKGKSWTVAKEGKTYHRVVAQNMPPLKENYFYEGWLVEKPTPGKFFTTGEMKKQPNGDFILEYIHDTDVVGTHKKIVITLEPDDGDPAPAAHIIEN